MMGILRKKLLKLVRGEDGVALVVTLALFMFLYVSCAGVYTVGRVVKDRIILQNAVDAAAYSAAVVQADFLSRIATINKAMAWNYAQFLKSQRNWIILRFLQKINENPTRTFNQPLIVSGAEKSPWNIDVDVRPYLGKDILEYKADIDDYWADLEIQRTALEMLQKGLNQKIRDTALEVLRANLPFEMGERCRVHIMPPADDILGVMSSGVENENKFLAVSADDDVDKLVASAWFEVATDSTEGFGRIIREREKLKALDWMTSDNGMYWLPRIGVDAYDIAFEMPHYAYQTKPLALEETYFPDKNNSRRAKGAITVAVAKLNENPWKGLVRDLTGIHSAFDYADKNDWTFAISSAQAGYRPDEDVAAREEVDRAARHYSLNCEDFTENLCVTDWDALYVPVRMAFSGDEFSAWMENETEWDLLVPAGERKYVLNPLLEIRFFELNHKALARMHNNGGVNNVMKWDRDGLKDFLDLMYH